MIAVVSSYRLGHAQALKAPKARPSATTLANLAKKAATKQASSPLNKALSSSTTSSGFYRLSGTVQTITDKNMTLKLTNGTVILLTLKSGLNYVTGTTKHPIKELGKGTPIQATGTIGTDGAFNVSAVQVRT